MLSAHPKASSPGLRRRAAVFAAWCFFVAFAMSPGAAQDTARGSHAANAAAEQAKATFDNVCAGCHGLDGRGGERGPDIASRREVVQKGDAELGAILKNGKVASGMPSFARYGTARRLALVAYLRVLQGRGEGNALPGDAAAGKALFFGSAKCSECHMVTGKGGFFAGDLSGYAVGRNAEKIRAAIVAPDQGRDPRRGMVTITRTDATVISGVARNEDNFSLQLQTLDGGFHLLNKAQIREQRYEGRCGMPTDYASTLTARELNDLVSFLMRAAGSAHARDAECEWHDGDDE
jgi:cytochrome c oxidase cbb3-type subunit III